MGIIPHVAWRIAMSSIDRKWFDVREGNLSETEINEAIENFRKRKTELTNKHLGSILLPDSEDLREEAKKRATLYVTDTYGE